MKNLQGKDGGVVSKQRLYQMSASHARKAIETLVRAMDEGENWATKVGAAKSILAKCIPDLKATEITGDGGTPIKLTFTVATEESKEQLEKLYERSDSGND